MVLDQYVLINGLMLDWNQVLSIVTVIATVALAVFAYTSFKETKYQASLMRENMDYDRLTKRYDRLNKEIAELVGPLISQKDRYVIFESAGEFNSAAHGLETPYDKEYRAFWNNIRKNIYLADKDLSIELQNYFLAIEKFKNSNQGLYGKSQEVKDEFIMEKKKLIQQIEISYKRLQREISDVETKLKIQ